MMIGAPVGVGVNVLVEVSISAKILGAIMVVLSATIFGSNDGVMVGVSGGDVIDLYTNKNTITTSSIKPQTTVPLYGGLIGNPNIGKLLFSATFVNSAKSVRV